MDLPLRVGDKFETFGVLLLDDETGDKMALMREEFMRDPENVTIEVLRKWLAGRGVEVSWESLIATLRKSKLLLMADQIQMTLPEGKFVILRDRFHSIEVCLCLVLCWYLALPS